MAKRADQISSELALHDFETNVEADTIVHAIHDLTPEIHAQVCRATVDRPTPSSGTAPSQ